MTATLHFVGEKFRTARTTAGLTQAELARTARVSKYTVRSLETEKGLHLRADKVARVASVLDVSLDAMITVTEGE